MVKMVVFLGNKGKQYEKTRHNIGWMFHSYINSYPEYSSKFNALYYKDSDGIIYLFPQKMMNLSGDPLVKAMGFFKINIDEVLVVYDDLETTFGSFLLKKDGGLSGHNGLRSIKEKTGKTNFYRLALGISRPKKGSVSSYVLGRFNPQEEEELPLFFKGVEVYFRDFLKGTYKPEGKRIKILQQIEE